MTEENTAVMEDLQALDGHMWMWMAVVVCVIILLCTCACARTSRIWRPYSLIWTRSRPWLFLGLQYFFR